MSRWDESVMQRSPGEAVAALVIADTDGAEAIAAIDATGARLLGRVDWANARARLEIQGPLQLIAIDCAEADDAALATVLPLIDLFARDNEARLVATLGSTQVDLVAANLFGPHVELLCAPSLIERVAAYALSLSHVGTEQVSDAARDVETARLRRLNDEIARIAATLARLSRSDAAAPPHIATGEGSTSPAPPALTGDLPPIAARDVRGAIRARRLRDQHFAAGLFEDPAWDILLDLFAAELERVQVSVSSLCIAAAVAPTTALRWIAKMADSGLLLRVPDPFDRRRAFMELSMPASEAMRRYLGTVKHAGLVMA